MITTNVELIEKEKLLEEQGIEVNSEKESEWSLYDPQYGKESIHRHPEMWDKKSVLNEVLEIRSKAFNRDKFLSLLEGMDDFLFQNVQKINFIEDEVDYLRIMSSEFENTDMIDFEEELGKYLLHEDQVLVNLYLIKEVARKISISDSDYEREVNIGIWTTLLHELRHVYQHSLWAECFVEEFEDIEEDAEMYAIQEFKIKLLHKDFIIYS